MTVVPGVVSFWSFYENIMVIPEIPRKEKSLQIRKLYLIFSKYNDTSLAMLHLFVAF